MTVQIVACGDSAKHWDGSGFSIGVNDASRWGHKLNALIVANGPLKFPQDRLNIIKNSKPEKFYSNLEAWRTYFPNMETLRLRSWDGHFYKDFLIHTDTSPTIAMGLARRMGAKKIVLWGCDFRTHKIYNDDNNAIKSNELRQVRQITEALGREGVQCFLGATGSALESFLPIHESNVNS